MMQHIKQTTKFSCLAACAAMITDQPIDAVFDAVGHDGEERPFKFLDIAAFLNKHGYHLGAYSADPHPARLISFAWNRHFPALLIVESQSGKGSHAVCWDGTTVLDPEPENMGRFLANYTVREWWPVIKVEE